MTSQPLQTPCLHIAFPTHSHRLLPKHITVLRSNDKSRQLFENSTDVSPFFNAESLRDSCDCLITNTIQLFALNHWWRNWGLLMTCLTRPVYKIDITASEYFCKNTRQNAALTHANKLTAVGGGRAYKRSCSRVKQCRSYKTQRESGRDVPTSHWLSWREHCRAWIVN